MLPMLRWNSEWNVRVMFDRLEIMWGTIVPMELKMLPLRMREFSIGNCWKAEMAFSEKQYDEVFSISIYIHIDFVDWELQMIDAINYFHIRYLDTFVQSFETDYNRLELLNRCCTLTNRSVLLIRATSEKTHISCDLWTLKIERQNSFVKFALRNYL